MLEQDTRPDPELLLRRIKAEEAKAEDGKKGRGKLKIYLGYAAGVGKTFTMLEAAHEAKKNGVDVVAGYIEPHARKDTQEMAEGLETIPPLMVPYKGVQLREFDIDSALKRHPQVCLVDELAHTNVEGMRHTKRYMDIEELLNAGINVWTTVNIQHLESLNDIVGSITGIVVKEKVPDKVFDHADQVEVIDIEPDELLNRLDEGKIYKKEQAERAREHFFAKEKLTALREIALRRTADRVNHLAIEEKKNKQKDGEYFTGEHVLVCLSPAPSCQKVIRSASRLAYAFHAKFTAIYVESAESQNEPPVVKKALDENRHLAHALGADIASAFGEDLAYQIAYYAKISNVSKIVLGRTTHRIWFGQTKGTLSERIAQYVPNIDIYIIPDVAESRYKRPLTLDEIMKSTRSRRRVLWDTVKLSAIMVLAAFVVFWIFGIRMAQEHVIMLVIAAFIISYLLGTVRRQAQELIKKSYRTELLLENSASLRRCVTVKDVENEVATRIVQLMNLSVIFYLRNHDTEAALLVGPDFYPRKGETEEGLAFFTEQKERVTADWVMQNGKRAGCCTHSLPSARAMYLPVKVDEVVYAVVGIYLEEAREINPFEYGIITAILNEASLAFSKRYGDFWGEELKEALRETEEKSEEKEQSGKAEQKTADTAETV